MAFKLPFFPKPKRNLLFLLVLLPCWALANETYQTLCVACHGKSAEGNPALNAPALAGLDASYLKRQLAHFKSGIRGSHPQDSLGQQMVTFAKALNDSQMQTISTYVSQLPATRQPSTVKGDVSKGKKIYNSNCAACHGNVAQGNPALHSPALTVQGGDYLLRQLKHFKQGIRGSHADDKYGRQMAMMAKTLPDEQAMKDVMAYIESL